MSDNSTPMNRVQLVGVNQPYIKGKGFPRYLIVARLYDAKGLYFEGEGETYVEAIGSLVCRCPEKFNAKFDTRTEFEEK